MIPRTRSIKTKFIISIFVTVLLFLGVLLALSYNTLKEGALKNAHDLSIAILTQTDKRINTFFSEIEKLAMTMAGYPQFYEVRPGEMKPIILSAVTTRSDYLRAIYLGTVTGKMYEWGIGEGFVDNAPILEPDYDPRKRPWFREAIDEGGFSISEPYMYASVKAMGITAVTPVYDRRAFLVGVLGIDMMLDDLKSIIEQLEIPKEGRIVLLNKSGEVIVNQFNGKVHSEGDMELKKFSLFSVEDLKFCDNGQMVTPLGFKDRYYITCTENGMTGWKLILALPYYSVMAHAVSSMEFIIFLDILLMLMLIVVLSYLSNAMIINPMEGIMGVMRRLRDGENDARIPEKKKDEFGVLARQFNRLIETVNDYSRSLEEKVEKRTRALEDLQKENIRLRVIEEKERIYGYLHDSLGARLTNIFISNSVAQSAVENNPRVLRDMLDRIGNNTEQGIADLKEILHSSESDSRRFIDFNKLIQVNIRKRLELKHISLSYTMTTPSELNELSREMRFELEKILQELVSNILKHSGASKVELVLEIRNGKIFLVISDDGQGGAENGMERGGFGLKNIQNRVVHLGGSFHLHSPQDKGTRIKIYIPLPTMGGC